VFNDLEGFTEYNLDVNYRSYQEIVDYASTVNAAAREANEEGDIIEPTDIQYFEPSDIICERGRGGKIFVIDGIGSCNCVTDYNDFKPYSDVLTVQSLITQSGTQVLCRSNKQVKKLQAQGIDNVSTIHQAKGLEYANVILVNFPIDNDEERNIAYVGMTRAKNNLCVINFEVLLYIICNEQITTTRKLF
jgi:DNA helicase IV